MSSVIEYQSLKGVLDRDMAVAESRGLIDEWSPYLEELVNYASNLLGRCEKSLKGVSGTPSALIYLYYHVIQISDGVHVMCSKGCFAAAYPALRSLWEAVISIEYMLKSDFEDRSASWMACSHLDGKEYWELQDTTSRKGQEVAERKQTDKYFSNCDLAEKDQNVVQQQIEIYNTMLSRPKFSGIMSKLKKEALRGKKWYSINGGADSVRAMADDLNRLMEYIFLYSKYSAVSHAKDASRMLTIEPGVPSFAPIRSASFGLEVYSLTCSYLLEATLMISEKLRPFEKTMEQLKAVILRHRREVPKD